MNIKKVFIVGLMAAAASALADVTITGVSAEYVCGIDDG